MKPTDFMRQLYNINRKLFTSALEEWREGPNWRCRMIAHVRQSDIKEMYQSYQPVFILSTGRSGTKFLSALFNASKAINAFHEPIPALEYFPNKIYQGNIKLHSLKNIVDATRMEIILDTFIRNNIYVESNHCLTFFCRAISEVFTNAKFIHIIRHPGNFIVSAARKGWYVNDTIWETGRIKMKNTEQWGGLSQLEKLGWYWHQSNDFIEKFKMGIDDHSRIATYRIEDLFSNAEMASKILEFIGATDVKRAKIQKIQRKKINKLIITKDDPENIYKNITIKSFNKWEEQDKQRIKLFVDELAKKYQYQL